MSKINYSTLQWSIRRSVCTSYSLLSFFWKDVCRALFTEIFCERYLNTSSYLECPPYEKPHHSTKDSLNHPAKRLPTLQRMTVHYVLNLTPYIRSLVALIPSLTPRFPHVVPSLKIWQRVEQGNQTQRTKTRTKEPREPKNHKNQGTTRTRELREPEEPEEPENQRTRESEEVQKKNGTRRRFYVTKSNKRNMTSAVAITLQISRISAIV